MIFIKIKAKNKRYHSKQISMRLADCLEILSSDIAKREKFANLVRRNETVKR